MKMVNIMKMSTLLTPLIRGRRKKKTNRKSTRLLLVLPSGAYLTKRKGERVQCINTGRYPSSELMDY